MSRKPAERPEQEQLSLTLPAKRQAGDRPRTGAGAAPRARGRAGVRRDRHRRPARQRRRRRAGARAAADLRRQRAAAAARLTLESRFTDVRVEGEVSGLKRSGNGHLYFCLKDAEAQLDCVLFSREAARLKFTLEEGMAVRCRGRLTLYEARGQFQMSVDDDRADGRRRAGARLRAAQAAPRRRGAVRSRRASARCRSCPAGSASSRRRRARSSATSSGSRTAAFRSRSCSRRRRCRAKAPRSASPPAIRRLEAIADVDVIIVARGGGSLEDLWAFNEEPVARAIFACRVPVISAVGHETDFTIADFVADLRAPTPSAAAERAVPVRDDLIAELALLRRRGGRALAETARRARHELERARARLGDPRRLLDERRQRLDEQIEREPARRSRAGWRPRAPICAASRCACTAPTRTAASPSSATRSRRCATGWRRRCARRWSGGVTRSRRRAASSRRCRRMRVLERGFSLTQRADGHVVTSAGDVRAGRAHHRPRAATAASTRPSTRTHKK